MKNHPVIEGLRDLARNASEDALRHIARCGSYGSNDDQNMHFEALADLIHNYNCEVTNSKNMSWYPLEAIELCSHGHSPDQVEGFAVSTAFMLIDDLLYERFDYMDIRLELQGLATYEGLPEKYSIPILAGIKLLDEPVDTPKD